MEQPEEEVSGINRQRVTAWLTGILPEMQPPLAFSRIAGGHSNLTFRFSDRAGQAWVLRRPPLGLLLESAHDMGREHRIIRALGTGQVPVPAARGLCQDPDVNGAPFYVMDFVEGEVLHHSEAAAAVDMQNRPALSNQVIQVLASLHALDPAEVGLGDLGRKEAYLTRQLKRWTRQWEASKTHPIPAMETSARLLNEKMPEQKSASIVHGDYRLGNMLVSQDRVMAVLDWELCTLGDPLADLGYLLNNWVPPEEAEGETPPPTAAGGFASREQLCSLYAGLTGRDLQQINYYRAFSHWRLAAIGQGVYRRYLDGAMGDDSLDLDLYRDKVREGADKALALLE